MTVPYIMKKTVLALQVLCILLFFTLPVLSGCKKLPPEGTKIVLTTGMPDDVVFYIEDTVCTVPEFRVYLEDIRSGYENNFGSDIWEVDTGTVPMGEMLRHLCLSHITKIKIIGLFAAEEGIFLDTAEQNAAASKGRSYFASLSDEELEAMGNPTEELLVQIMTENALAGKFYEYMVKDINPEISDDEARRITVEQIETADYETAYEIKSLLAEGRSFEELMTEFGSGRNGTISFGKGEADPLSEEAAFRLEQGQVSGIIETENGYVIYKCISTFNREETETNKERILNERRQEGFFREYDAYAATKTRIMNEKVWESIK